MKLKDLQEERAGHFHVSLYFAQLDCYESFQDGWTPSVLSHRPRLDDQLDHRRREIGDTSRNNVTDWNENRKNMLGSAFRSNGS